MPGHTETDFAALVAAQCGRAAPSIPAKERAADVVGIVGMVSQLPNSRHELNRLLAVYGGMIVLRPDSARRPRLALYWRSGFVAIFPPVNANEPRYISPSEAKRMMATA
jgi:predicted lipoprotein